MSEDETYIVPSPDIARIIKNDEGLSDLLDLSPKDVVAALMGFFSSGRKEAILVRGHFVQAIFQGRARNQFFRELQGLIEKGKIPVYPPSNPNRRKSTAAVRSTQTAASVMLTSNRLPSWKRDTPVLVAAGEYC